MKAEITDLQDSFKIGYEAYYNSRIEAEQVWDLYHNRHFTQDQLNTLANRGQPAETFNVVKMFSRMLVGYLSTIVNTVKAVPVNPRDALNAALMNDTIKAVFEENRFDMVGDQIKLSAIISGVLACETNVVDTGVRDRFGRPINRVVHSDVPTSELVFDPQSTKDDYSDAMFLHRFKWVHESVVAKVFGKDKLAKLTEYYNHLEIPEADFEYRNEHRFNGKYKVYNNYLIVHSVLEDDDGKRWSCFWCDTVMLDKQEITFREARWPYRIQFLHRSDNKEYYGLYREIIASQHAINQAVIKLQQLVNTEKVYVEENAVADMDEFSVKVARVNAVVPVLRLNGIKVEHATSEVREQYNIIDSALNRIQRVLGINDSFLGMAFASDSGRKVKLQQNATIMSLRYVTSRIEAFYRSLGEDTAKLIKQYYTANQILAVSDEMVGERWIELNKPIEEFSGQFDPAGQPVMQPILMPMVNPDTNEPVEDEAGNLVYVPVNELETELAHMDFKIRIEAAAFNDEDERAQLMLETVMSGQIGSMMSQVNPAGFFKMSALAMKSMKTKYTPDIVDVLNQTAQMLGGNPEASAQASQMAQGMPREQAMSRSLKLPTNTNEEAL